MLYREPKMEILELKTEDVIRTSGYHNGEQPGDDYSDTKGQWPV